MAFSLRFFLFNNLPIRYKIDDTYKDNNDRGLLERYLEIFGLEVDEEITPLIQNYINNVDPTLADEKFLNYLAYTLGNPPDMWNDPVKYAKLLRYIMSVYKVKGTILSYQLFFALLGFSVSVVEYPPIEYIMDEGHLMDEDKIMDTHCPGCSDYDLIFSILVNPNSVFNCSAPSVTVLDQTTIDLINKVIKFIEPINAHLRDLITGALVCESVSFCYTDDVTLNLLSPSIMDNSLIMDDSLLMDTDTIIDTESDSETVCHSLSEGSFDASYDASYD